MFKLLKKKLLDRFEEKIVIDIFEVDEFKKDDPYLVSKVDRTKFIEKEYLI